MRKRRLPPGTGVGNAKRKEFTCEDIEAILLEYIDKEMDERILYQMERHRMSCAHCTKLIKSFRLVIRYLKAIEEKDVPEEVHQKLLLRIENLTWKIK
jgi:hypothetical protein|uniref:Zf-HC2 domain-containing protein n=1 Tax=candidate division WOR-3 bacterium TaxID=2052148 RepID=A0A7C3UY73_UNCW3